MDADLRARVLPYWHDTAVDWTKGGYRLRDERFTVRGALDTTSALLRSLLEPRDCSNGPASREKHLVAQARLLYVFSLAHRRQFSDVVRHYLRAAQHGYEFLTERMVDAEEGGCLWRVDHHGRPLDATKRLYGQAFAIYALCEYHRASQEPEPLAHALALFRTVNQRMRDRVNGGWSEHLDRDFCALPHGTTTRETGFAHVSGRKTAGGYLHWMEALSELADVTGDPEVRDALEQALGFNTRVFFERPSGAPQEVTDAWRPIESVTGCDAHYGHNLEAAWLMRRAQQVLRVAPTVERLHDVVAHALRHGFDWRRGGFYSTGSDRGLRPSTDKVWWVQAEGLVALSEALAADAAPPADFEAGLRLLLDWIWSHQRSRDGIWAWSTDERGVLRNPTKAGNWKAGYHEVRAMCRFIDIWA
jgi:cellobiose epimerase